MRPCLAHGKAWGNGRFYGGLLAAIAVFFVIGYPVLTLYSQPFPGYLPGNLAMQASGGLLLWLGYRKGKRAQRERCGEPLKTMDLYEWGNYFLSGVMFAAYSWWVTGIWASWENNPVQVYDPLRYRLLADVLMKAFLYCLAFASSGCLYKAISHSFQFDWRLPESILPRRIALFVVGVIPLTLCLVPSLGFMDPAMGVNPRRILGGVLIGVAVRIAVLCTAFRLTRSEPTAHDACFLSVGTCHLLAFLAGWGFYLLGRRDRIRKCRSSSCCWCCCSRHLHKHEQIQA